MNFVGISVQTMTPKGHFEINIKKNEVHTRILPEIFLTVQKSNDNSNMTVTNTPIKEPENVDPNK